MGLHFLIIDDSDLNLKVVASLLSKLNITNDHVTSALDAYSLLENKYFDMILMDYLMPDINGIEASEYIRNMFSLGFNTDYFRQLPIVMLTAEDNFAGIDSNDTYNSYLKKPVTLSSLENTINRFFPEYLKDKHEEIKIEGLEANPDECYSYLEIFVSSVGNIVATIESSLKNKDYDTFTVEVHRLKGEAQIISATALAKLAYELECTGKAVTGRYPNDRTEEENLLFIDENTPVLLTMVDNLKKQFIQYKKGNILTSDSADTTESDNNCASALAENNCFDIQTKDKIIRYLDYALESINDNNIVNAITWIDGIKDILTDQQI